MIEKPVRTKEDIINLLRTDRAADLGYVFRRGAPRQQENILESRVPVIGFCGAPFTLASYMIEGSGSRNYVAREVMSLLRLRVG